MNARGYQVEIGEILPATVTIVDDVGQEARVRLRGTATGVLDIFQAPEGADLARDLAPGIEIEGAGHWMGSN